MKSIGWFFGILCGVSLFMACNRSPSPPSQPSPQPTGVKSASSPLTLNSQPASPNDLPAAEWNSGKIYLSQIDRLLEPRRQSLAKVTNDAKLVDQMVFKERRQVLDTLVDNYLLLTEAHSRNLSLTSAEMEQLTRGVREQFNSESEYKKYLQQTGRSEAEAVKVLANIRLGQKCMEDQKKRIQDTLTPDKLKQYYDEHVDMFTGPHRTSLNRVEIRAGEKRSWEEAEKLARKLYEEVKPKVAAETELEKKRKFLQDCAYKYSDTAEAQYNYGYVVVIHNATAAIVFTKPFVEEARKLEIAQLSSLIKTQAGYAFFLVVDQNPSMTQPFESTTVQSMLPNMIMQNKLQEWHEELKQKYGLKIYSENLEFPAEKGKIYGNSPPVFPTIRS